MNPADVEQREGRYPAPPGSVPDVPGLEVSGSVVTVGTEVTRWKVGRPRVRFGGRRRARRSCRGPRGLRRRRARRPRSEQAAAVPEAFITAHDALRQGDLAAGETVLVRGATGAVGSAAVQIARGIGATAYAPVRDEAAGAIVRDLGAIPLPSDGTRDALMEQTDGRGVDVVIELVGGDDVVEDVEMLALRGRIIVVSVAAGATIEMNLLRLMVRRATVRGTVLRSRPLEEKTAGRRCLRGPGRTDARGRTGPSHDRQRDLGDGGRSRVRPAHRTRQAREGPAPVRLTVTTARRAPP